MIMSMFSSESASASQISMALPEIFPIFKQYIFSDSDFASLKVFSYLAVVLKMRRLFLVKGN